MWDAIRAHYLDHSAEEMLLLHHQLSLMNHLTIIYNVMPWRESME